LTPAVALVSARRARGLDEDEAPLVAALRDAGARTEVLDWDDPSADWGSFDLAVLRSTWDYTERLTEFLLWSERVAGLTVLSNPAAIVRWNTDKHYLSELARAGVPTVPSTFVEPGEDAAAAVARFTAGLRESELVVKPAVGAGSRDARRYPREERTAAARHARQLLEAGRSVLLQPYLDSVSESGETALVFFGGDCGGVSIGGLRFDHAIRKGPMLPAPGSAGGGPAVGAHSALFVAERITPRIAQPEELAVAAQAFRAIPGEGLLYARVDLIRDSAGAPVLLELELTEPSLFFAQAPGSAQRFAEAVLAFARSFTV